MKAVLSLEQRIKVSLGELRMQTLGAQILLGFQLESVFQTDFVKLPFAARASDALALLLIILTFAVLLAPAADHRIVSGGRDNPRTLRKADRYADLALLPFALAMGCDSYVVFSRQPDGTVAMVAAVALTGFAVLTWYGLGNAVRSKAMAHTAMEKDTGETSLHGMIEQMLTESRVVLPGAQALLGFQFVDTLTHTFTELPASLRFVHYMALIANAISVALLIAPAAVHRIAYEGRDSFQFHRLGSLLIACALAPLAFGISADTYVVVRQMLDDHTMAIVSAAGAFTLFIASWYVVPLVARASARPEPER